MKIRSGFVSNSSSSSFILYGTKIPSELDRTVLYNADLCIIEDVVGTILMSEVENETFDEITISEYGSNKLKEKIIEIYKNNNIDTTNIKFGYFAGSDYN